MKIEIQKDKKGNFYFRVLGGNNREMLRSGSYANKRNLADAVAVLKAGMPEAKVVDEA
jgi:uncharacterized protein YegP (UPF0339 family)